MHSILTFSISFILLLLALVIGLWIEGFAYWFMPDAFFLMGMWLLFIQGKLNFFALALISALGDIYLGNFFGASLLSLAIVLYLLGIIGFGDYASSPVAGSIGVLIGYFFYQQVLFIANLDYSNLIEQHILLTFTKSLAGAFAWLLLTFIILSNRRGSL